MIDLTEAPAAAPTWTPSASPALLARIAAGTTAARAVAPLLADAAAAYEEARTLLVDASPAEPTIEAFAAAWSFMASSGAEDLADALVAVVHLVPDSLVTR